MSQDGRPETLLLFVAVAIIGASVNIFTILTIHNMAIDDVVFGTTFAICCAITHFIGKAVALGKVRRRTKGGKRPHESDTGGPDSPPI